MLQVVEFDGAAAQVMGQVDDVVQFIHVLFMQGADHLGSKPGLNQILNTLNCLVE